jgi:regulator of sirC expression with transglutaminase-like and TPR domain
MSRHPFDLLMELDADHIRLDCAALHLARDRFPHVDIPQALAQLDALADEVLARRPGLAANLRYDALKAVLVDGHKFTGDEEAYYKPENCYLHRVLAGRRGLPITLSIIWIEVARRLKWPVAGVALPGHFIVRIDDPERFILVDPFYGGRTLALKDCRELVRQQFGKKVRFSRTLLEPVGVREILARLLRNLRNMYLSAGALEHVLPVLQRMAAVEPGEGRHLQELAAVFCRLGDVRQAYAHLELYLRRQPDGRDAGRVRDNLRQLRAALAARN